MCAADKGFASNCFKREILSDFIDGRFCRRQLDWRPSCLRRVWFLLDAELSPVRRHHPRLLQWIVTKNVSCDVIRQTVNSKLMKSGVNFVLLQLFLLDFL